jgi:hypothetical protein
MNTVFLVDAVFSYGVISQKMIIIIVTAVETSNLTSFSWVQK